MSRTRHGLSCGWFNSWAARYDMSTVYDMYRYDPGWATGEIEKRGCRGYTAWWWSESLNRGLMVFRPFAEPLDVRWLEGMMSSFEVRTGTLDDAFIRITGEEME